MYIGIIDMLQFRYYDNLKSTPNIITKIASHFGGRRLQPVIPHPWVRL